MKQYLDYLRHIREKGVFKSDRTGTGTYSVFGYQMRFDLSKGFPLVTTKKAHLKSIIHELIWFLSGSTNISYLQEHGVTIWDEWATNYEESFEKLLRTAWTDTLEAAFQSINNNPTYCRPGASDGRCLPDGWVQVDLEYRHPRYWELLWLALHDTGDVPASLDMCKEVPMTMEEKKQTLFSYRVAKEGAHFSPLASAAMQYEPQLDAALIEAGLRLTKPVMKSPNGSIGPGYGYQWRSWPTPDGRHIDQISEVINTLRTNPDSRRIIVSAWNVADVPKMNLPACHAFFQFYVENIPMKERVELAVQRGSTAAAEYLENYEHDCDNEDEIDMADTLETLEEELKSFGVHRKRLSCQLYQRSCDSFLGVPFNIASYALLTMMVAQVCDMEVGDFVWTGGDCHIYQNHLEQVDLQLSREPLPLPKMVINPNVKDIFEFKYEDFTLEGYQSHPAIKAPVAV